MMRRIQNNNIAWMIVGLLLLLLVVLIRGEILSSTSTSTSSTMIHLGDHVGVPNMILVRVQGGIRNNQTEWGCSTIRISDLFPDATIDLIATTTTTSSTTSNSSILSTAEPVLVTIYNPELDQVCETQRKHLRGIETTTTTPTTPTTPTSSNSKQSMVRIYQSCYDCASTTSSDDWRKESIRIRILDDATTTTRTVLSPAGDHHHHAGGPVHYLRSSGDESTANRLSEVFTHSIQYYSSRESTTIEQQAEDDDDDDDDAAGGLEVTISISPEEILVRVSEHSISRESASHRALRRRPAFQPQNNLTHIADSLELSSVMVSYDSVVNTNDGAAAAAAAAQNADETTTSDGSSNNNHKARAEPSDVICSLIFEECCIDTDCPSGSGGGDAGGICVGRTCIDQGFPRFTLSWEGKDDFEFYVVTPGDFTLSVPGDMDKETGGRVGESTTSKDERCHVHNAYFPMDGSAPAGTYQFYVRPLTSTAGMGDEWTLEVVDETGELVRYTGTRFSPIYEYIRGGDQPSSLGAASKELPEASPTFQPGDGPEPSPSDGPEPQTTPVVASSEGQSPYSKSFAAACDPLLDECCADSDCLFDGEVCFNRNCIDNGNPRITLSWDGDDDLDLFVLTPNGAELSFMNFFDPISGGRFGEDVDQFGTGHHVENVYFPMTGGPYGNYQFFMRPLTTVEQRDIWTLTVVDNGSTMMSETGSGPSPRFTYHRERPEPTPTPPTTTSSPATNPTRPPLLPRPTPPSGPGPAPTMSPANNSLPTSSPEPTSSIIAPTRPPSPTDTECNKFFDECCESSDCRTSRDVCEQRTCIRDGNPRFTLIWDGDDDLDLFVFTPDGIEISQSSTFDIFSGGRFEMDPNMNNQSGKHVESVYFPLLGTPTGVYKYEVRSTSAMGESDTWILEVYEGGELVTSDTATGSSEEFEYVKDDTTEGPQRPIPSPPRCSPLSDECCLDSDCQGDSAICVQRTCIEEGSPRITLRWTGDDDLNLRVETPNGVVLTRTSQIDPITGGRHQESTDQGEYGFHVENVYFPADKSAAGSYKYAVESVEIRGVGADVWRVSVYEEGQEVENESGIGDSREFVYERLEGAPPPTPTPPTVTPPPADSGGCSRPTDECCQDKDCNSGHVCANRHCISEGNPRVTLTWIGDDDLDLYLRTPFGDVIYFDNRVDKKTGGAFDTESRQSSYGYHTENIYFPMNGSPQGRYTAGVRVATARGVPDAWTVRFYDSGVARMTETGAGDSQFFTYNRGSGGVSPSPTTPIVAPPASPPVVAPITERPPQGQSPVSVSDRECPHECCSDSDCGVQGEICAQRTCIKEGTPRFTLTWTGNDDLSLVVVTPGGKTISYLNQKDLESQGIFEEDSAQDDFGFHVENIFFPPNGGLEGEYKYFVKSAGTQGSADRWALRVYAEGELVAWKTGTGESRTYTYGYGSIIIMPTAAPALPPFTVPPVQTRPPVLAPTIESCQTDSQCSSPGEVCIQETCINDGNPRFTLVWSGNDDLDFFVETPGGAVISKMNPYDDVSGGIFGGTGDQSGFDRYVENIYFLLGPSGTYSYYVQRTGPQGSDDFWEASVSVNGESQVVRTGSGDSAKYTFDFDSGSLTPIVPTPAPEDSSCNSNLNECCSDVQCLGGERCTQRTCINEGNPQFTLTWTGNDDLDLIVQTPLGTFVTFLNDFDEASGGQFGVGGDQFEFGRHVENVFFPLEGGPNGTYNYYVRSFLPIDEDDAWTVNVFVNGQTVASQTGTGDSGQLTYDYSGLVPTPSPVESSPPPTQAAPQSQPTPPPDCSPTQDECCSDSDCITGVETCVQTQCIDLGNPRFTLTWTGDDDLDLKVETPFGSTISFVDPLDEASGGVFGDEGGSQYEFGKHVESIYFKEAMAPIGVYKYTVDSYIERSGSDRWTVTVFVDNQEVASQTGFGDSVEFTYDFEGPGQEIVVPLPSCEPDVEECCDDSDCRVGEEICVQRTCIDRGNPRFTLTWTGDDDLDLTVVTPFGTTLAIGSPTDDLSGGEFGEEGDQETYGEHVENVFFPMDGGPTGTYTFLVASFYEVDTPDEWLLTVYVNDVPVLTHTGTGTSDFFVFENTDGFTLPPAGTATARSSHSSMQLSTMECNIEEQECCSDSECTSPGSLCVQRICIDEGNPRFTLSWNGNDDYDLVVTPPFGNEISFGRPNDSDSGGRFGGNGIQSNPGMHAENVFFPLAGGPLGTYVINVQQSQLVDEQDAWSVGVYVDGQKVDTFSGSGESGSLTFEYTTGGILSGQDLKHVSSMPDKIPSCSSKFDQCCINEDCSGELDRCLQRSCIPIETDTTMIVLTWLGDDDLDLTVITPSGQEISYYVQADLVSGAFFEQSDADASAANERAFSIYLPHSERVTIPAEAYNDVVVDAVTGGEQGSIGASTAGIYRYKVSSFNVIGSDDHWTTQVFVNGVEVSTQAGQGDSQEFIFEVTSGAVPSSAASTPSDLPVLPEGPSLRMADNTTPAAAAESRVGNCTTSSDCPSSSPADHAVSSSSSSSMCLLERCLNGGSLQFTLAWWNDSDHEGDNDLVLSIWAPPNSALYQSSSLAQTAGWQFIDDQDSGLHVRNLAFSSMYAQTAEAAHASAGKYKFSITKTKTTAGAGTTTASDSWKLWIHKNGQLVYRTDGATSASSFFGYDYNPDE